MSRKSEVMVNCGCLAFAVGGICLIAASFTAFITNWSPYDRVAFSPIVWSPDGKELAFGVEKEFTCTSLFVVNSDGSDLREIAEIQEDELDYAWCFQDLRWSADADRLLFGNNCVVEIESDVAQCVPSTEIPQTATPAASIPSPYTECDEPNYVYTRAVHSNGLIAQSACLLDSEDYGLLSNDCIQTLQVCDTQTGKVVFELDDYILGDRPPRALATGSVILMGMTVVITAGGLLLAIVMTLVGRFSSDTLAEIDQ